MKTKEEKRIRVLEEQRRRDRQRLLKIKDLSKKMYNVTSQIKIKIKWNKVNIKSANDV